MRGTAATTLRERYRLLDQMGAGGFGAVYSGYDQHNGQLVAIKVLFDHTAAAVRQFQTEAQLLASLEHPVLPAVIDHFVEDDAQYLVMELIPGEDLGARLARHPDQRLSEAETLEIVLPLLDALEYLHSHAPPVIHRDIKPGNIRLSPYGVRLVDFGVAKAYDPATRTTIGARAVTSGYSPLEQYGVGPTDARSDLYALGATIYTMLSGTEVPDAPQRALEDTLEPLRQHTPAVSPELEAIVMRLLAMQPADRYPNVAALRRDLEALPLATAPRPAQLAPPADAAPMIRGYAAVWQRVLAALLDLAVVGAASLLLAEIVGILFGIAPPALAWAVAMFLGSIYPPLLESGPIQGTLGKLALRIAVTDLNGDRITLMAACLRHFYRLGSAVVVVFCFMWLRMFRRPGPLMLVLGMIPLIVAAFTTRRQAIHDLLTNCVVVQWRNSA